MANPLPQDQKSKLIAEPDATGLAIKSLIEERKLTREITRAFRISAFREKSVIVFPCYSPKANW